MTHPYTLTRSVVTPAGRSRPVGQTTYHCKKQAVEQLVKHALRFSAQGWQVKFEDDGAFTALKSPNDAGFCYEIEAA